LLAATAALISVSHGPGAHATAPGGYSVYLETDYSDDCGDDSQTFWRTTGSGKLTSRISYSDSSLAISADGRQLAYSTGNRIQALDLAARGARPRVAAALRGGRSYWRLWPLALSPSGSMLFALARDYNGSPHYYLFAGGRRLRTLRLPASLEIDAGSWSRLGLLAVSYRQQSDVARIALLSLSGRLHKLGLNVDDGLAWTANGARLLYGFHHDIRSAGADGRDSRILIRHASLPAASPDGARLAFVRERLGRSGIWISDTRGGDQRRVAVVRDWGDPASLAFGLAAAPLPAESSGSRSRVRDC
jgi:hypothetical protein